VFKCSEILKVAVNSRVKAYLRHRYIGTRCMSGAQRIKGEYARGDRRQFGHSSEVAICSSAEKIRQIFLNLVFKILRRRKQKNQISIFIIKVSIAFLQIKSE